MRLLIGVAGLFFFVGSSFGSVVLGDSISVSTIAGPPNGSGISISTNLALSSGASLSLQGPGGVLSTSGTITASSFFGDGRALSSVASLSGSLAFSGSNTFASSFTVQSNGGAVGLSTSATVTNISISPAGVLTFYPQLHNSSATTMAQYSTTMSTFGPCVPGSTVTIVTSGGAVEVKFSGNAFKTNNDTSRMHTGVSFLQDGAFVRDLSPTKAVIENYATGAPAPTYGLTNFAYLVPVPAAGTHSYCLTIRTTDPASGVTLGPTGSNTYEPNTTNLFYVIELK